MLLTETTTDMIAAGPAKSGIARGNTLTLSVSKLVFSSLRSCLLLNNISSETRNNIIPPAILRAGKVMLR